MLSKTREKLISFDDMTLLYKRFLRLIGILPFEGQDFNFLGSRLLLAFYIISSIIHWSMFLSYIINGSDVPSIDTICETVVVVGVDIRYYLLIHHRLEITNLLDECRAIWELCDTDGRRAVRQFEQKMRLLFQFLFGTTSIAMILYSMSAINMTLRAIHSNDTQTRFLPFKWYSENGPYFWPGYKITFALQVLVIQNSCIIIATVDTAGPFLIMIGAGYFRALRRQILLISNNKGRLINNDFQLVACARLHQRILNFCARVDKTMRSIFLVQILSTGYNISLAMYKLAGTDPDRYKFISVTLFQLAQMFVCQWAPDHLIVESEAISTAVYNISVIWMPHRLGKLLVLIMARAQRPVQMTAAGMINLSLEKFGSMLTSALSFFTVLRNFIKD